MSFSFVSRVGHRLSPNGHPAVTAVPFLTASHVLEGKQTTIPIIFGVSLEVWFEFRMKLRHPILAHDLGIDSS